MCLHALELPAYSEEFGYVGSWVYTAQCLPAYCNVYTQQIGDQISPLTWTYFENTAYRF